MSSASQLSAISASRDERMPNEMLYAGWRLAKACAGRRKFSQRFRRRRNIAHAGLWDVGSPSRRARTGQFSRRFPSKGRAMNWTERRERLRAIVEGGRCIFPASVYDGISARIAADVGFEAMMFAGSVGSFSVIAAPDLCVLTLTEFAQQAYRINRAGALPLCVDADHGYGNALSVKRTVEELETAGVSALTIEDTLLPAPFGGDDTQLISIEEGVGKMRAALAGRQDPRLVIVGGNSAIGITGVEDTIARLQAYEAAGVDMLFIAGLKSREQLDAVASAVKKPLLLGSVPEDMMDLD